MNTYWRLLGFAKPIEKYAIPYFFYTLFYAAFNTFNFVLVMPILDTLFQQDTVEAVRQMPAFALNMDYFRGVINFLLYKTFGADYSKMDVLVFLGLFIITSSMLSNFFRHDSALQFRFALIQFFESRSKFFVRRDAAVPLAGVLHKAHALTLDRVGNNHARAAGLGLCAVDRVGDRRDVMSIDRLDEKAEG